MRRPRRGGSPAREARARTLAAVVAAGGPLLWAVPAQADARAVAEGAKRLCTIDDPRIDESSGLAASRRHPGIVYTFNDSGGSPRLFALGIDDCKVRAAITLGGARNRDWEAMAIGADGDLYVGDIGDNLKGQPYSTVYRIPEPRTIRTQTVRATAYRIKFEDGPHNAETLMIDPRTNRLYVASKEFGGSLYEGPKKLSTSGFNVMRHVGDAPLYATDGAYAPDGRTFVIRGYWDAEIYTAPGKELTGVKVPDQKLGEGITYTADGRSLLFSGEGVRQPLWREPVPKEALPSPTPKSKGHASPADGTGDGMKPGRRMLGLVVVGALALAGVVVFARRRAS
ncbi:WD40 repeat domain-containing protein [Actinoallomurus liliacearum]|uniref:WD40 repeat domain-containing protein n=1 Tax=Actinoallomurus liliacearum TaxID=1080073 RepID=A0ABP8TL26_9ACTN